MLRPGNTKTFDEILAHIDEGFGKDPVDQDHIVLTHSHDETEEMESEYWRKIVERIEANGAKFLYPHSSAISDIDLEVYLSLSLASSILAFMTSSMQLIPNVSLYRV